MSITRKDLKEMGEKSNTSLTEEAKKARNAYRRTWAKNNPDKVKEYTRNYWERKAQELAKEM